MFVAKFDGLHRLHGSYLAARRHSEFPLSRLDPDSSTCYSPLHEAMALSTLAQRLGG